MCVRSKERRSGLCRPTPYSMRSLPDPKEEWSVVFNRTIDETIHAYKSCGITFDGDHHIFTFIERNRRLSINRPQCFLAGDYNLLNMMVEHGNLTIIDFECFETGDPWNEFNGIVWSAIASPHFAAGQIHGYFEGEPPATFFELMAVYIGILLLSLMSSWAVTSFTPSPQKTNKTPRHACAVSGPNWRDWSCPVNGARGWPDRGQSSLPGGRHAVWPLPA